MVLTGDNRSAEREICTHVTLSATNPTLTGPGSKPGLRGKGWSWRIVTDNSGGRGWAKLTVAQTQTQKGVGKIDRGTDSNSEGGGQN